LIFAAAVAWRWILLAFSPLRHARARAELAIAHRINDRSPRVKGFVKVGLGFRASAAPK
jgi:hypothetical protein